jgi:uncharacterized membrane protein YdbT with pleckstrin-like domain
MTRDPIPDAIRTLEQPHAALWTYYIIRAILTGPGIVAALPYLYFRYHTLRYRFDEEGIHMRVGILFRREVNLTYSRIQDIHLRSGLIQRWLGLADVQVQTASGSSGPELVVEGFKEFEFIRDFLYTRMRGYQSLKAPPATDSVSASASHPRTGEVGEIEQLLANIRDEMRQTRKLIESAAERPNDPGPEKPPSPPPHV